MRVAPSNLDKFAYIGVFSMGLQEGAHAGVNSDFVERNAEFFDNPRQVLLAALSELLWANRGRLLQGKPVPTVEALVAAVDAGLAL